MLTCADRAQTASEVDVNHAVEVAQEAFKLGVWSKAPRQVRADVLDKAAEMLTQELPGLIALEVKQTGRPIREMQAQVPSLVRWFKYYAAFLRVFGGCVKDCATGRDRGG